MDGENNSNVVAVTTKPSRRIFSRIIKFVSLSKIKNDKLRKIIYILFAAVILSGIGGYFILREQHKKQVQKEKQAALVQSNLDISKHDYSKANESLQKYLSEDLNDDDKYSALVKLGIVQYAQRDNEAALRTLLQAEEIKKTNTSSDVYTTIASIYMAQKQNAKAIDYLKKAIARVKVTKDPGDDSLIPQYESLIKKLGGTV